MKDIIAAVKKAISDLRNKADTALKKLGPIDQLEVGREVLYGLNSLEWTVDSLKDISEQMDAIEAKLPQEAETVAAQMIEDKITAGEFVRKTDHDLALEQAKKDGKGEAEEEFKTEKAELQLVTGRRLKLTTDHGAVLAATIPDAALKGDDAAFALVETEATRRVTELGAFGIKPETKEKAFKEIVAFSYDDDGIKAFDARVEGLKELGLKPDSKSKEDASLSRQAPARGKPPVTTGADNQPVNEPAKKPAHNPCF